MNNTKMKKTLDEMTGDEFMEWMNTKETNEWWDKECEKRKDDEVNAWKAASNYWLY